MNTADQRIAAVIRAAVNQRYRGQDVVTGLADYQAKEATQTALALRWGISRAAVAKRLREAAAFIAMLTSAACSEVPDADE